MEPLDLSEAAESSETSGAVKSEDGSPTHSTGRGSPPPNCAICLGRCRNKSFTDSCLHQFCFKCLLTWSKVKTECPLCKQNFKSIIHNVKSNQQYEEYPVQQPQPVENMDLNEIVSASRFRYRTTLTLPRRETIAIRQLLMHFPMVIPSDRPRRTDGEFRRTVYRHNLWSRPLPDFTGRFRDCSPEFFQYNDSQVHRLVPWLYRELYYLLNYNNGHVTYVLDRVLELLPQHPILSEEFRTALRRYLGERTDHFLHELHCFASTPYDLQGYDRHVQYGTATRLGNVVSEVLSSSDTDSRDSDIVMVTSSRAATPPLPSEPPAAQPAPSVIPIETISHSDSGSDSEVMLVGYVKPPHQRTPELVDLLASDSDVVVAEDEPEPAPLELSAVPLPPHRPMVRFQLSMRRDHSSAGRRRSQHSDSSYMPSASPPVSSDPEDGTPPLSTKREAQHSTDTEDDTDTLDARKRQMRRRKSRRKPRVSRADARSPRRRKCNGDAAAESNPRFKGKSRNGKNVKCSAPDPNQNAARAQTDRPEQSGSAEDPGTSVKADDTTKTEVSEEQRRAATPERAHAPHGKVRQECKAERASSEERRKRRRSGDGQAGELDRPGPSGLGRKRRRTRSTRDSRDKKKLRSVVQVIDRGEASRRRARRSSSSSDELPLRRPLAHCSDDSTC